MLKAKNIIIIFILNYLLILLACCVLEIIFITNNAQQVQLIMRTAADMALEQIQATDDYFTSGGGYIMETDVGGISNSLDSYEEGRAYQLMVNTGSQFEQVDLFPAITGESSFSSIYNTLYGNDRINNFIEKSIEANNSVLSLRMAGAIVEHGDTVTINSEVGQVEIETSAFNMYWYSIPKLCMMGNSIVDSSYHRVYDGVETGGVLANSAKVAQLWNMYDLANTTKKMTLNGRPIDYYLTPISLGITYINPELVQTLFMNNLDLLMRAKYMQDSGYNLNSEEYGNGMLKGSFYPELVDTSKLQQYNPINNGSFTLLRGYEKSNTGEGAELFQGTCKPKIEYMVIDAYDTRDEVKGILQQIYGPRLTKNTTGGASYDPYYLGREVSGALFKEMDNETIREMKDMTNSSGSTDTIYDHKPIVVAKVTFYADFIIPYSTVSLREMRGRESSNLIGGSQMFNAFSESMANSGGTHYLPENYVDLEIKNLKINEGSTDWGYIYPTAGFSSGFSEEELTVAEDYFSTRPDGINSDAMAYTTFFAITP